MNDEVDHERVQKQHTMAAKARTGLELSDYSSKDDDENYFMDLPDKNLSKTVRMTDKLLNNITVSDEVLADLEKIKKNEQAARQIPVLNDTTEVKLPSQTNCMVCSDDGLYLFLGHAHGLAVISTSTLTCVRTWQDKQVEITSISCTSLGNVKYLLGTVDDMGIARLFIHHMENIYLIKAINETDDINQRNICARFEVSESGTFGAAVIMSGGSVWLEVYHFPQDVWLAELETKQATQSPQATEAQLSPIVVLMKIKPPEIPTGTSLKSPFEVLQKTEKGTIIGTGQNHLISSQQWEYQNEAFRKRFAYLSDSSVRPPQQKEGGPSNCTCHFLFHSVPGEVKAAGDIPVAVCLWWNGSFNLLQYPLLKTPEKTDSEPRPAVLWPNSQEILCSAVSSCTRFIVLGLENQLVTIWDRQFGWPYANIVIPGDSAISRMEFLLKSEPLVAPLLQGPYFPTLQLVLTCRSGACYSVTAGRGEDACSVALTERPADPGSSVSFAEPVPFLKCLALLIWRNGQVSLWEMEDGAPMFILNLPHTHVLSSLREPVCVLEPAQQKFYVIGERKKPLAKVINREEKDSSLFIFSFAECSLMNQYHVARPGVTEKVVKATLAGLEEATNLYFKERAASREERSRKLAYQLEQLSKHGFK